jgi:hypothetical protein
MRAQSAREPLLDTMAPVSTNSVSRAAAPRRMRPGCGPCHALPHPQPRPPLHAPRGQADTPADGFTFGTDNRRILWINRNSLCKLLQVGGSKSHGRSARVMPLALALARTRCE